MTEENGLSVESQSVENTEQSTSSASEQASSTSSPEPQEKSFNQYQVNDIVREAKKEAADRARRDYETKNQQQQNEPVQRNEISEDKVRQLINEQSERMSLETQAQQIAQDFSRKMIAAKEKHPDFEEKISQLNLPSIPQLVQWTNSLDNTADVMYEIASHPSKFSNLLVLANTAPHMAIMELNKLSNSIKSNEVASKEKRADEPLSQIKPTITGTDNGSMSIKDLRNQDWLQT